MPRMLLYLATAALFAFSAGDGHDHDHVEVKLATAHQVIEYCEEACTTAMVNEALTSAHVGELYTKVSRLRHQM